MLSNQTHAIYQSGEVVPTAGMYEVVGTKRTGKTSTGEFALRELQIGERFPCYEGRMVAWHFIILDTESPRQNTAAISSD